MRLPPNYYYGSDGSKTPSFHGTTKETVDQKHKNNGRYYSPEGCEYYSCIYCENDKRINNLHKDRTLHARPLMQIDHIVPFSIIINNIDKYYSISDYIMLSNLGYVPRIDIGSGGGWDSTNSLHLSLLYNDIDNLHLACTAHNQDKGNTLEYLGLPPNYLRNMIYPNP